MPDIFGKPPRKRPRPLPTVNGRIHNNTMLNGRLGYFMWKQPMQMGNVTLEQGSGVVDNPTSYEKQLEALL